MAQPRSAIANAVRAPKPGSGLKGVSKPKQGYANQALTKATKGTNVPAPSVPPQGGGPTPVGTTSPWDTDPISQSKFTNANTNYSNAIGYDASNRESLVNSYGWGAIGPNGETINPVYSPFSIASLLQRTHDINRRGAVNGAGLNLYSGATTSHLQQADFRYGQEEHSKRGEFEEGLGKIKLNEQEALEGKQAGEEEGKTGAVERAGQEPNPVVPEDEGPKKPGLGADPQHPKAYKSGVGAGKEKPKAPPGYHAYKGADNQWWFAPN
jgi:hypothetical protein